MILIICVFLFFATFFLATSFGPSSIEKEIRRRMRDRLHDPHPMMQENLRIEKKERISDLPRFDQLLRHFNWIKSFQTYVLQADIPLSTGAFMLTILLLAMGSLVI